jgi:hypothetical protein
VFNNGEGEDWAGNGGHASWFADFYNENQFIVSWSNINAFYQDYEGGDSAAVSADEIATNSGYLLESVDYGIVDTFDVNEDTAIMKIKIF